MEHWWSVQWTPPGNAGAGGYDNGRKCGPKKVRRCQVCEEPHATFRCPLIVHEKDEKKLKASFEEKGICVKCLFKHNNDECYSRTAKYFFVMGWEIAHHYISLIKCILQSIKGY